MNRSSIYHSQPNSVERMHPFIKQALQVSCFENKEDWEVYLPAKMVALRSASRLVTGFSPAELVYGRAIRSPLWLVRESWKDQGEKLTVVVYVIDLLQRLNEAKVIVYKNIEAAQRKPKICYVRTAKARASGVNDKVILFRPCKHKLEIEWEEAAEEMGKYLKQAMRWRG